MEPDIQKVLVTYKELQAEFTAVHQNVEQLRSESMSPGELKKEITQLEAEKEQLLTKINTFKDSNTDPDFKELLNATSNLRKEQEQEQKYMEKQEEQRNYLEYAEQTLYQAKHRLMEAKKMQDSEYQSSAETMLSNLKKEV